MKRLIFLVLSLSVISTIGLKEASATCASDSTSVSKGFRFRLNSGVPRHLKYRILTGVDVSETGKALTAHYSGFSFGPLGLVSLDESAEGVGGHVDPRRSFRYDWGFFDLKMKLSEMPLTFVTGLGIQFDRIYFKPPTYPTTDEEGYLTFVSKGQSPMRSRIHMTHLTLPLILETNYWGERWESPIFLNAGVVAKIRTAASVRNYREDGEKEKVAGAGSFWPITFDIITQIGWDHWGVIGTYSPLSIFKSNSDPRMAIWSVGLRFYWSQR